MKKPRIDKTKAQDCANFLTLVQRRMYYKLFDLAGICTTPQDVRELFHCTKDSAIAVSQAYSTYWDRMLTSEERHELEKMSREIEELWQGFSKLEQMRDLRRN
jgi:hypothetical protein